MPVPVITVAQMREWEKATWAAGVSEQEVIEKVGRVLTRRLLELTREGDAILVLAGKGHNGDDARAAVPHLKGREVTVLEVVDPAKAIRELEREISKLQSPPPYVGGYEMWIVDGLFGIGLNRPLDEHWKALIEKINSLGVRVLAIDVPSGLNADTGKPEGAAIHADVTLTVGAPKRAMLDAAEFVGRLEVAQDVGLVPCPAQSDLQ
ncbi:MAG: NAD(P)H-hydrate epimerase, partial [Limisphaerales bacterium]